MFRLLIIAICMLLSFSVSAATLQITNPTIISVNDGNSAIQGSWQDPVNTDSSYNQTVQSLIANTTFSVSWDLITDAPSILSFDFLGSTIAGVVSIFNNETPVLQQSWENFQPITGLSTALEAGVAYKLIVSSYMYDGTNLSRDFTLTLSNIQVSEVPLPAAVWLFGSVLLGGLALRRKRQKSVSAQMA